MAFLTQAPSTIRGAIVGVACLVLAACTSMDAPMVSVAVNQHVAVATADGQEDALLFAPQGAGTHPAIILFPDLTGLRPVYQDIGRRLSDEGYVVLVPNAFYRTIALDGTAATAQPRLAFGETMQRAAPWRAAASDDAIIADTKSLVAYLDSLPQVDTAAGIGVLGLDIGGAHAFIAARAQPDRITSVAVVHPLSIATTRDTSPHLFVAQSKASYLIDIAAPDDEREPADKDDLRAAFANAGLDGTVRVIAGSRGYFVADDPAYDAAAASQSWLQIIAHFAATLR